MQLEMNVGAECGARGVRREAALTSEGEAVAQVLSSSQGQTLASSLTCLTAVSGLRAPWFDSGECWARVLMGPVARS